jgi:myo-inositol 2-dehydrogenase/D-chiro-inositol 1-dehydrogenase
MLGVGVIGAGEAAQAIHIPVLARLAELFRVTGVYDPDLQLARGVAEAADARAHSTLDHLLGDSLVDVVVVCSPPIHHREQVALACAAGKRAILCEKPLVETAVDASAIVRTVASSGVPLIVGTMHYWDPSVRASWNEISQVCADATVVRSRILLPPNERFVAAASDPIVGSVPRHPATGGWTLERMILGLASHDIPLIRQLAPVVDRVNFARTLSPWGYQIVTAANNRCIYLTAMMLGNWSPDWTLLAQGSEWTLRIEFPPSYVLVGSATVELTRGDVTHTWRSAMSGYEAQWRHLADVVAETAEPAVSVTEAAEDLAYALNIAGLADKWIVEGEEP